jgi:predicted ATP-binding protein involved in virulence
LPAFGRWGIEPSAQWGIEPSAQWGIEPSAQWGIEPSAQWGIEPSAQWGIDGQFCVVVAALVCCALEVAMNIKSLRVQNFKCFEDKSFEFSQGFNLIVGDNGTGKTAVLDALAVALSNFLGAFDVLSGKPKRSFVRVKSILEGELIVLQESFPTTIWSTFSTLNQDFQQAQTIQEFSEALQAIVGAENFNKLPEKLLTATHGDVFQLGSNFKIQMLDDTLSTPLPLITKYSTARLWLEKQDLLEENAQPLLFDPEVTTPGSRLDGYKNALDVAISNKSWLKWFTRMELISLQEKKPLKTFEAVKQAVQTCLEGCDLLYFDIKRGEPVARIQGNLLPFSLLSDGQRSMLAMVADIAYRMAQLNPHLVENVALETPGVVLIDELDLHLHPKWQRKVVDNLRRAFPKVQFFATSHSPFIIQSLRPGELIDLNQIDGAATFQNQSIEDIAEKVQGVELPQLSQRKQAMFEAAKRYYSVLEDAKNATGERLDALKAELDELSMPFSDDMAYHAFLEMERLAALKENA